MKKSLSIFVLFVLFTFLSGAAFDKGSVEKPRFAENRIKIKLSAEITKSINYPEEMYAEIPGFDNTELDNMLKQFGNGTIIRAHRKVNDSAWERRTGFDRWVIIIFESEIDVQKAVDTFKTSRYIEEATPEFISYLTEIPNDPLYPNHWGHNNTAQFPVYQTSTDSHTGQLVGTPGFDSKAQLAWDHTQGYGNSSVVIAILDTGVDTGHPDLRLVNGYDFGDNDNNPMGTNGHGTSCSGIAAAKGNNNLGIAGIAGGCSVMPVKVMNSDGYIYNTYWINGLTYAADNNVPIVSMSFGSISSPGQYPSCDDAITYADSVGVCMFASTGNDYGDFVLYPANHQLVIGVGAAAPSGERKSSSSSDGEYWWGSNAGSNIQDAANAVDIMAPTILPTTDISGSGGYDTGNYYSWFNGTSCSAPYVAGVAALLLSKDSSLTSQEIRSAIVYHATDMTYDGGIGWDRYTGYGLVNANAALSSLDGQNQLEEDCASFVLTNEGTDVMIDALIDAGCTTLYDALIYLRNHMYVDAPSLLTGQMDALIDTLDTLSGTEEIFTAWLSSFSSPANSPVGINADGTYIIADFSIYDYDGHTGYARYTADQLFTYSTNHTYDIYMGSSAIDLGGGITKIVNYKAFAVAWDNTATTFVLSNEGGLIDDLIRAGHGNLNLYETLAYLKPLSGGVLTDEFMAELSLCPLESEIFTEGLYNFSENYPVCINTDGTVTINPIYGNDYFNQEGYETNPENQQGYTPQLFTYATSPEYYINAGSSGTVPGENTIYYKAFAIAWKLSTTFVLSNEAPGYLIDWLIDEGYGESNLYEVMQFLKPNSGGVITDEFMASLAACPAGSEIYTAHLNYFAGLNGPVCINADGTLSIQPIFGYDCYQLEGWDTYESMAIEDRNVMFTYALSPEYYVNAGEAGTGTGENTIYYKAFAVAWDNNSNGNIEENCTSFVLTEEDNDFMIEYLVNAGCTNLYEALVYLRNHMNADAPVLLSSQMDALIDTLDTLSGVGEVFTAALTDFTGGNSPVGINADGTFIRADFSIYDYDGHTGYARYTADQLYTYSTNPAYDIYMGSSEVDLGGGVTKTVNYKAFTVAWDNNVVSFPENIQITEDFPCLLDYILNYGTDSIVSWSFSDPAHGQVEIIPARDNFQVRILYTPDSDYYGEDSYTVTASINDRTTTKSKVTGDRTTTKSKVTGDRTTTKSKVTGDRTTTKSKVTGDRNAIKSRATDDRNATKARVSSDRTSIISRVTHVLVNPANDSPINTAEDAPYIEGTPEPGEILKIDAGNWNDDLDTQYAYLDSHVSVIYYEYQWQYGMLINGVYTWTNAINGNNSFFEPDTSYCNLYLRCEVIVGNQGIGSPEVIEQTFYTEPVLVTCDEDQPLIIIVDNGTNQDTNEDVPLEFTVHALSDNSTTFNWFYSSPIWGFLEFVDDNHYGDTRIIRFTPNLDYNGYDSFVIAVFDDLGQTFYQPICMLTYPINDAPQNTVPPVISGEFFPEQQVTVNPGEWTDIRDNQFVQEGNESTIVYSYQWQISENVEVPLWNNVPDAVNQEFTLPSPDNSYLVRCMVTAADDGIGELARSSASSSLASNEVLVDPVAIPGEEIPAFNDITKMYPNPFQSGDTSVRNEGVKILLALKEEAMVSMYVYNVKGQKVDSIAEKSYAAGYHEVNWKGTDDHGSFLSTGIYFVSLQVNGQPQTIKKILIMK